MSLFAASLRELGADVRAVDVAVLDPSGNQLAGFDGSRPATAGLATVVVSTTSIVLAASNAARRRIVIHNDSTGVVFIAFAATATVSAFTYELGGNATYDGPLNDYTGVISAIRASGSSNVRVTEITT